MFVFLGNWGRGLNFFINVIEKMNKNIILVKFYDMGLIFYLEWNDSGGGGGYK